MGNPVEIRVDGHLKLTEPIKSPDGVTVRGQGVIEAEGHHIFDNVGKFVDIRADKGGIDFRNAANVVRLDNESGKDIDFIRVNRVTMTNCQRGINGKIDKMGTGKIKKTEITNSVFRDPNMDGHVHFFRPWLRSENTEIRACDFLNIDRPPDNARMSALVVYTGNGIFKNNTVKDFNTRSWIHGNTIVYPTSETDADTFYAEGNHIENFGYNSYPQEISLADFSTDSEGQYLQMQTNSTYRFVASDKIRISKPGSVYDRAVIIITHVKDGKHYFIIDKYYWDIPDGQSYDLTFYLISAIRYRYQRNIKISAVGNDLHIHDPLGKIKNTSGWHLVMFSHDSFAWQGQVANNTLVVKDKAHLVTERGDVTITHSVINLYENPYMRSFYPHNFWSGFYKNKFINCVRGPNTKHTNASHSEILLYDNYFKNDAFDQTASGGFLFNGTKLHMIRNKMYFPFTDSRTLIRSQNHEQDSFIANIHHNIIKTSAFNVFSFNNQIKVAVSDNRIDFGTKKSTPGSLLVVKPLDGGTKWKERFSDVTVKNNDIRSAHQIKSRIYDPTAFDIQGEVDHSVIMK